MWIFGRKTKKGEIKRVQAPKESSRLSAIKKSISPITILIGVGFIVVASGIIIIGGRIMLWRLGQRPRQNIYVRVPFKEVDVQATEETRKQARESTPNYYKLNKTFLEQIKQDLTEFYNLVKANQKFESLSEDQKKFLERKWDIKEKEFQKARETLSKISQEEFHTIIERIHRKLISSNLIEVMPDKYQTANKVVLIDKTYNVNRQTEEWTFAKNQEAVENFVSTLTSNFPTGIRGLIEKYLLKNFKPVWLFDKTRTNKERQIRYAADENIRYEEFQPGMVLVVRGKEIGKRELHLLELEHKMYWKSIAPKKKLLAYAGIVTLVTIITIGFGFYCYMFKRRILQNWARALAIAFIALLMLFLGRVLSLSGINIYASTFEIVLLAMVITIAYDQRFALMMTGALICLFMIMLNGIIALLLSLLSAGFVAIFTLDDVRTRSKIIEVATASAVMSFAVVFASQLADFQEIGFILRNGLSSAAGALLAGFVVQGILPLIEDVFKIATSMTLLEWSDPSKPLLRKLAIEVPGTFNHSLLIGSLAESAAEAIGANPLLARVGAYYHDIGKINKPQYFVENQPSKDFTRHKDLTPAMSLLIIIGHVKDGLELAKEYNLPTILHQFIAEHHGTTVVEYFYHQASQQAEKEGRKVSDTEFRYPGPKPHSKESAIVMLADSVEGATRALSEPTASRIEATVHQIIRKRLEDGQLDECDLTLRELNIIEESLTKSLCAIYHSRVKYPSQKEIEPETPQQEESSETRKVAKGY